MTDAGFFKGTSADQDSRFSDKNKKLMKTMKFADNLDKKIDMKKIKLEVMKPFITNKLNAIMPVEDEVIIEYVFSQLEESQNPDGKSMQIMLTGFLGKTRAKSFMGDLWQSLTEAQESPHGIPRELIEMKKTELLKKQEDEQRINASLNKSKDAIEKTLSMKDAKSVSSTVSSSSSSSKKEHKSSDSKSKDKEGRNSRHSRSHSRSRSRSSSRSRSRSRSSPRTRRHRSRTRSRSRSRSNSNSRHHNRLSSKINVTESSSSSHKKSSHHHKERRHHHHKD